MIDVSEINAGETFLFYDETFNHKIKPEEIDILDYVDGFINHTLYEYTNKSKKNFCPIITLTKELASSLFPIDELVDLTAIYYKANINSGDINTVKITEYQDFLDTYPEKML